MRRPAKSAYVQGETGAPDNGKTSSQGHKKKQSCFSVKISGGGDWENIRRGERSTPLKGGQKKKKGPSHKHSQKESRDERGAGRQAVRADPRGSLKQVSEGIQEKRGGTPVAMPTKDAESTTQRERQAKRLRREKRATYSSKKKTVQRSGKGGGLFTGQRKFKGRVLAHRRGKKGQKKSFERRQRKRKKSSDREAGRLPSFKAPQNHPRREKTEGSGREKKGGQSHRKNVQRGPADAPQKGKRYAGKKKKGGKTGRTNLPTD